MHIILSNVNFVQSVTATPDLKALLILHGETKFLFRSLQNKFYRCCTFSSVNVRTISNVTAGIVSMILQRTRLECVSAYRFFVLQLNIVTSISINGGGGCSVKAYALFIFGYKGEKVSKNRIWRTYFIDAPCALTMFRCQIKSLLHVINGLTINVVATNPF